MFCLLVFAAEEPIAGFGGRAYEDVGTVGAHDGQYLRTMIGLREQGRTDKVAPASDVNLLQFRNDIGILESTINDGYHHAFT